MLSVKAHKQEDIPYFTLPNFPENGVINIHYRKSIGISKFLLVLWKEL
jgi:hypothetical protein